MPAPLSAHIVPLSDSISPDPCLELQLDKQGGLSANTWLSCKTACVSVRHSVRHNRKSSHYFILWLVSPPPGSPSSHQHHQAIKPFSWRSICRRLLLGTWNSRTLVLHLEDPLRLAHPLPPSLPSNRIDSPKIATTCWEDQKKKKGDPIPASLPRYSAPY